MIEYKNISSLDYGRLPDIAGYYCVTSPLNHSFWIKDGTFHRIDGPAIISLKQNTWYLGGLLYSYNKEFQTAAKLSDEDMAIMILKYGNISL